MLRRLLTYLSDLDCDGYIKDTPKENIKDPVYALKLKGAADYSLSIFGKLKDEDKENPAVSSQNDYTFLLSDSIFEYIQNTAKEVFAPDNK